MSYKMKMKLAMRSLQRNNIYSYWKEVKKNNFKLRKKRYLLKINEIKLFKSF